MSENSTAILLPTIQSFIAYHSKNTAPNVGGLICHSDIYCYTGQLKAVVPDKSFYLNYKSCEGGPNNLTVE